MVYLVVCIGFLRAKISCHRLLTAFTRIHDIVSLSFSFLFYIQHTIRHRLMFDSIFKKRLLYYLPALFAFVFGFFFLCFTSLSQCFLFSFSSNY